MNDLRKRFDLDQMAARIAEKVAYSVPRVLKDAARYRSKLKRDVERSKVNWQQAARSREWKQAEEAIKKSLVQKGIPESVKVQLSSHGEIDGKPRIWVMVLIGQPHLEQAKNLLEFDWGVKRHRESPGSVWWVF